MPSGQRPRAGASIPEPPSETRSPYPARPRSRHPLHGLPQAAVQDPGLRQPRRRQFYRTRLTHSLEVAQIARAIARALRLDEDLTEALALAHDLGHPPFGHAGRDGGSIPRSKDFGGFDHNAQSLRVVTLLEARYAAFDGLNLTWETLEGLVKHNGPIAAPRRLCRRI